MRMLSRYDSLGAAVCVLAAALLLPACARTNQTRRVRTRGFLGDYSKLEKGPSDEALLTYTAPGVDFKKYKKIVIDPVAVWITVEREIADLPGMGRVSATDKAQLAAYLYDALARELGKDYEVVRVFGPNTLRFRAGITEMEGTVVVLDVVSNAPPVRVASTAKRLLEGTHLFVGRTSVEAELRDSETGKVLAAGVERRAGSKTPVGVLDTWDDVKQAYDHIAVKIRKRLAKLRAR